MVESVLEHIIFLRYNFNFYRSQKHLGIIDTSFTKYKFFNSLISQSRKFIKTVKVSPGGSEGNLAGLS